MAGRGWSRAPSTTCATRRWPAASPQDDRDPRPGHLRRRRGLGPLRARHHGPPRPVGVRRLGLGGAVTTDRVAALVAGLTLDEKAALTAGADLWHTAAVPRLGIPAVRLTDGPNGKRGAEMGPAGPTSTCLPCGSALGATWSPEVVGAVGRGHRGRGPGQGRGSWPHRQPAPVAAGRAQLRVLLEDLLLSGRLAAAFVRARRPRGGDDGQAPGGQRRRDRALHDELRRGRAGPAGSTCGPSSWRSPRADRSA